MINLLLYVIFLLATPSEVLEQLSPAILTVCNETRHDIPEGERVLQVAVNRSLKRNKKLFNVLTEKYQFNTKKCQATLEHLRIALKAYQNTLDTPGILKNKSVEYYDGLFSQDTNSSKCPGYTVGDVWEYNGLVPVCRSPLWHIFFKQVANKPGCPPPTYKPLKLYKKVKIKC